jgi:ferrous iron transport protein B
MIRNKSALHCKNPSKAAAIVVAVAGNPNSGKSTIFNSLTGSRQHVGNYPGVTVERKQGRLRHEGREIKLVDLPGVYSLTAYSTDEMVARECLIDERPDVVVDVIDAANLERNLYLAVQLIELGIPLILVMNMSDLAESRGCKIDVETLSKRLGAPVVCTIGHKSVGIDGLKDAIVALIDQGVVPRTTYIAYHPLVEKELAEVASLLDKESNSKEAKSRNCCRGCSQCGKHDISRSHSGQACGRRLAIQLLENDEQSRMIVTESVANPQAILAAVDAASRRIEEEFGDPAEIVFVDQRYAFISDVCQQAVSADREVHSSMTERIDRLVTHRILGIPIFLALMFLVFASTFAAGRPLIGLLDASFHWLGQTVGAFWPAGSDGWLKSLVVDGVIGGVGGVLMFLPNIVLLFLAIGLLEDTGYMSRAAFMIDRLMHKIGLHGKSFIPMLIGFGCTVPAVLGTRVLENRRDRLTTILVLPLMSCSARLPIYTLLIPAFFPVAWQAPLLWTIYLIGIVLAICLAKLLRGGLFKGEAAPFVMELPPYRLPTLKSTLLNVWHRGWQFLYKAGTVILGISIVLWAMSAFPKPEKTRLDGMDENQTRDAELAYSFAGRLGRAMEPVMRPIGFDWQASTAMLGALAAKEVFVSQMGIVHSLGDAEDRSDSLSDVLRREYSPLQAFCIMLFCLISSPCAATLAAVSKETGSWRWAAAQWIGLTLLAYCVALVVYQIGSMW